MITPLAESFRSFLVRGDSGFCGTVSKRRLVFDGHDDQLPHVFAALPYTRATVHEIDNGIGRVASLRSKIHTKFRLYRNSNFFLLLIIFSQMKPTLLCICCRSNLTSG